MATVTHSSSPRTAAPLLLTADDDLITAVLPLAAAADVAATTLGDPRSALGDWNRASVVLVGADLAESLSRIAPDKRPHVFVLTAGRAPDGLFRTALHLGAEQVVEIATSAAWLVELLTDLTEKQHASARVIGVVGGSGGAGATTFACALCQAAASTGQTVVIDCDPHGPGLDRVLGLERVEGFRWDALCQTTGRLSARSLREALPRRGTLSVLSWYAGVPAGSLQAFAAREALSAARRGHDTVVVDLPRTPNPLIDELIDRCDQVLLMTVGSVAGVSASVRMRDRLVGHPDVSIVVRGQAVDRNDVEAMVRLPVRAQMSNQPRLDEAVDLGFGPLRSRRGPLARAVAEVLRPRTEVVAS